MRSALLQFLFDQRREQRAVLLARVALLEARVGLELRGADEIAENLPLLLLVRGDVDVTVLRDEGARWGGGEVVVA